MSVKLSDLSANFLYIHACNVHQGGGARLLNSILNDRSHNIFLIVDSRMQLPSDMSSNIRVKRVLPTISHRFRAELYLKKNVSYSDTVLCFGNLPPIFNLRGNVIVFLQNRYLVEKNFFSIFSKMSIRVMIERVWFTLSCGNVGQFVVQTPTMRHLLKNRLSSNKSVKVIPFVSDPRGYSRNLSQERNRKNFDYDFVYVASGDPHKNHRKLIDAWCLLAKQAIFPVLCLTLDEVKFSSLLSEIFFLKKQYSLKVINVGCVSFDSVTNLYSKSAAAIYPSRLESLGLPLIEARQAGLPVLASELDYVRDVLDPEETFDPDSPLSISRAVKRFMLKVEPALPLQNAEDFLNYIFKGED